MSSVFELKSLEWLAVRPDVAHDVFGKTLLDGRAKGVLTRVLPGGKFTLHRDRYAHLFHFLSGEGTLWIGDKQFAARAGLVAHIDAAEDHAYENTGGEDLVLVSLNIPAP